MNGMSVHFLELVEDIHLGKASSKLAGVERVEIRRAGQKCKLHGVVENSKNPCELCSIIREMKRFSLKVKMGKKERPKFYEVLNEETGLMEWKCESRHGKTFCGGEEPNQFSLNCPNGIWRSKGKGGRSCCQECANTWKQANNGVAIMKKFNVTYGINKTDDGLVATMAQEIHSSNCEDCKKH